MVGREGGGIKLALAGPLPFSQSHFAVCSRQVVRCKRQFPVIYFHFSKLTPIIGRRYVYMSCEMANLVHIFCHAYNETLDAYNSPPLPRSTPPAGRVPDWPASHTRNHHAIFITKCDGVTRNSTLCVTLHVQREYQYLNLLLAACFPTLH